MSQLPPELSQSLYGFTFAALQQRLKQDGVNPIHARSLWRVLYRDLEEALLERTDFPPPLNRWLQQNIGRRLDAGLPEASHHLESGDAQTHKLLLDLGNRDEIETVVMAYPGRHTACLSTQVGCAMGCVFCATGQMGFMRHLTVGEIVAQVVHAQRLLRKAGAADLRNLVMMGMGEPLHNYDAVMQALEIVSERGGLNIAASRITVSTVGVVPGILRLAEERRPYNLAVSLHGVNDEERSAIVPVNKRWPLGELLEACRIYSRTLGRRVLFGWTLIDGRNDSEEQAVRLADLLAGMDAHVNLIRLNPTKGFDGVTSGDSAAEAFRAVVQGKGLPCTIRQFRGVDVDAGCGQLRASVNRK